MYLSRLSLWEAAKARFLEGLSSEEIDCFKNATPENLFYDASNTRRRYVHDSRVSLLREPLSPLIDAIDDYGKAFDVLANTYGLVLSPIWGGLRIVLHVSVLSMC